MQHRYFVVNKPYNTVSQFVSTHAVQLLSDLAFDFPPGTHAIGRLDRHSEGLLLLTTNKSITRLLFESGTPHIRRYLVQVNNTVGKENLAKLRNGISIPTGVGTSYCTVPCEVMEVSRPELIYPFPSPVAVYPPYTWLQMELTEGKYHQVRKMLGAIHHRCKRLIRVSIESVELDGLAAGGVREMKEGDFFEGLDLKKE